MPLRGLGTKATTGATRVLVEGGTTGRGVEKHAVLPALSYRLVLAARSQIGLGFPIITDVFGEIGVIADKPLTYTERLNQYDTLEFSLPIDHELVTQEAFAVGEREIHLYRLTAGGTEELVFGGRLWTAQVKGWEVRFVAYGWWFDLTRREVSIDFAMTGSDQFEIVHRLIDQTQAMPDGNLGITYDDNQLSGTTRKLVICLEERRLISESIEELAASRASFDFAIRPNRELVLYPGHRGVVRGVTFDGLVNLGEFGYEVDATEIANLVTVLGPAEECKRTVVTIVNDGTSSDLYGLLQDSVNVEHIHDEDWRIGIAAEELRNRVIPDFRAEIETPSALPNAPNLPLYGVGDTIIVNTSRGPAGGFGFVNEQLRVVSRMVQVDIGGEEIVRLEIVREAYV